LKFLTSILALALFAIATLLSPAPLLPPGPPPDRKSVV